jgi:hypothetical protein
VPRSRNSLIYSRALFPVCILSSTGEEPQLGFKLFLFLFHSYVISLNASDLSDHGIHFTLNLTFLSICGVLIVLYQTNLKQIGIFEPMDMLKQAFLVKIDIKIVIFVVIANLDFLRSLIRFLRRSFGLLSFDLFVLGYSLINRL